MPETWSEDGVTLVEGIGDEVVWCLAGFVTVLVLLFTWFYLFRLNPDRNAADPIELPSSSTTNSISLERNRASEEGPPVEAAAVPTAPRQEGQQRDVSPSHESNPSHVEEISAGQEEEEEESSPEALRQRRLEFFIKNNCMSGDVANESVSKKKKQGAELPGQTSASHAGDEGSSRTDDRERELSVRLKYLNDTERCVSGRPSESIGEFRRRHFASELLNQRTVRLIFNGAQLSNDAATLLSCGIQDGCVVHVHISTAPPGAANRPSPSSSEVDLNLSALMWPLFGAILAIVWFLHFQYKELFNASSTVILVGISGLFCVGLYGQHYHPLPRGAPAAR